MERIPTLIHIVAPNPDGRKQGLLVASCVSASDVPQKIAALGVDIDQAHVFSGLELPLLKRTVVEVGEPRRKRGRPFGSKTKRRGKLKTVGDMLPAEKKEAKKVKAKPRAKVKVVAKAKRANKERAKETQAERNKRVEAAT